MSQDTAPPDQLAVSVRLPQLDILRGIAILLVLGRHKPLIYLWYKLGWTGVDLFFVLSGFLIANLLFGEFRRSGTIDVWRFYLRRAFKIYPGFYLLIGLTPLLFALTGKEYTGRQILHELLFIQNYCGGLFYRHTWSLAIEEHFYLLLPLLLLALIRNRRGAADPFAALPAFFAVLAVVLIMARQVTFQCLPFMLETHHFPTHLRIDALLFGVLLAYLCTFRRLLDRLGPWQVAVMAALGVLLVLPAAFLDLASATMNTVGLTGLYLGYGLLMLAVLKIPVPVQGLSRCAYRVLAEPVATIGKYSYSIYLWHMGISHWVRQWYQAYCPEGWERTSEWFVYLIVSLGTGILLAKVVEFPFLRLRDRLYPSRVGARAAGGSSSPAA